MVTMHVVLWGRRVMGQSWGICIDVGASVMDD